MKVCRIKGCDSSEFYKGRSLVCKSCSKAAAKAKYWADGKERKCFPKPKDMTEAEYHAEYYQKNKDRKDANSNARKRRVRQAAPNGRVSKQVKGLYQFAAYLTKEYGKEIHVDHIIPLVHDEVCGLHVINNLQLMYAKDNQQKSNKWSAS